MSKIGIIEFDKLEIGDRLMQGNTYLREWRCPLPNLTDGYGMFHYCTNLKSWNIDLPSLDNGEDMFRQCFELESFSSDLSNLTNAEWMFAGCSNLKSLTSDSNGSPVDLSNLKYGGYMFTGCKALTSWDIDLPNLTNGYEMFAECSKLTSFSSDLSNLTNGYGMFYDCELLENVTIKLKNLENANSMFKDCGSLKTLRVDYYDYAPSGGIDCREMFNGCDVRNMYLYISLLSERFFRVSDGRRMFGYPEEKDSNGNLTSNYVLNATQWGELVAGRWWVHGADNTRGAIFEATVDSNIMVTQSDGSQWCSATNLFSLGFRYFRIKYKDSNGKPAVVYGQSNMSPQYTFEKPNTAFWKTQIDDLSVAWVG